MKLNFNFKFKKLFSKKEHPLKASGPDSDWHKIFTTFGILTVLVLIGGLYVFFAVQSGTLFTVPSDENTQAPRLNISVLNKTVSYYENRGADFNNILSSQEIVKDPSR